MSRNSVPRPEQRQLWLERSAIGAAYLLLALAATPWGDFPLNDDWDFAVATWSFARSGEFEFTRYTAASLKAQVVWGALWTWIFGESFHVLRASTMALALGTLLLIHDFLARAGVVRVGRLIGPAAVMVHPVFFWSSLTYMTQIPYLFLSVAAVRSFALAFSGAGSSVVAGGFWAATSWFVRQTGVVNAAAALVAAALPLRLTQGRQRGRLLAAAAGAVFLFLLLFSMTSAVTASPAELDRHAAWGGSAVAIARNVQFYTIANLKYAALFFLPLVLALVPSFRSRGRVGTLILVFAAMALSLVPALVSGETSGGQGWRLLVGEEFRDGNLLHNFGLGPPTLPDVWRDRQSFPVAISGGWRLGLTAGAALAAALLVCGLGYELRGMMRPLAVLLVSHLTLATAVLALSSVHFDRYSLDSAWTLAVLLPAAVDWGDRRRVAGAVVGLLLIGIFTVGATGAYFSWNRARWSLATALVDGGVPARQIDAGYEWNSFVRVWPGKPALQTELEGINAPYFLTFAPQEGCRVVGKASWTAWGVERHLQAHRLEPGCRGGRSVLIR